MDEKNAPVIMCLYDNPYSTGKEIAQYTGLSKSNVSKHLNALKKEGIVNNKTCQPQKGKNYTGKCWFVVNEFNAVTKITAFQIAQKDKIVEKIRESMELHEATKNAPIMENEEKNPMDGFFTLCDIIPEVCPQNIDPRKVLASLLVHDVIFELERTYYETKIAPYNQAIESAETQEERYKAIKRKEDMKTHILEYVLTPRPVLEKEMHRGCTEKEKEWINFKHDFKSRTPEQPSDIPV